MITRHQVLQVLTEALGALTRQEGSLVRRAVIHGSFLTRDGELEAAEDCDVLVLCAELTGGVVRTIEASVAAARAELLRQGAGRVGITISCINGPVFVEPRRDGAHVLFHVIVADDSILATLPLEISTLGRAALKGAERVALAMGSASARPENERRDPASIGDLLWGKWGFREGRRALQAGRYFCTRASSRVASGRTRITVRILTPISKVLFARYVIERLAASMTQWSIEPPADTQDLIAGLDRIAREYRRGGRVSSSVSRLIEDANRWLGVAERSVIAALSVGVPHLPGAAPASGFLQGQIAAYLAQTLPVFAIEWQRGRGHFSRVAHMEYLSRSGDHADVRRGLRWLASPANGDLRAELRRAIRSARPPYRRDLRPFRRSAAARIVEDDDASVLPYVDRADVLFLGGLLESLPVEDVDVIRESLRTPRGATQPLAFRLMRVLMPVLRRPVHYVHVVSPDGAGLSHLVPIELMPRFVPRRRRIEGGVS